MQKRIVGLMTIIIGLFLGGQTSLGVNQDFVPDVNVVTTKGNVVSLNQQVAYLANNQAVSKEVMWETVPTALFDQVGTHQIKGKTSDGLDVTGNIHVYDANQVKVAAVGDSITYGMNVENVGINAYPKQLNYRLGSQYQVQNYGHSGRTLINNGDAPYIQTNEYRQSLALNPHVVVIQLGTNDTKAHNYVKIDNYVADYLKLIDSYRNLSTKPVIYLALPPKISSTAYGIQQSNLLKIVPLIFEVAEKAGGSISIIDNLNVTRDAAALIPDGVHPNAEGAAILANNVYQALHGDSQEVNTQMDMNRYTQTYGGINSLVSDQLQLTNLGTGEWFSYEAVNLESDTDMVQLFAAIPYDNTKVVIHKDRPNGPIVGERLLSRTASSTTFAYYPVPLNSTDKGETLYFSFERPNTARNYELARVAAVKFNYDASQPFMVKSFQELQSAIASNLTNIKVMADINFNANLQLKNDTTIDFNQHSVNVGNYYITKDESAGQRINVTLKNGELKGQNATATLYVGNSASEKYGFNVTYDDFRFSGNVTERHFVKNSTITLKGTNQTTLSLSNANTIKYEDVKQEDGKKIVQLFGAVPYDNTIATFYNKAGQEVGRKVLTRTGSLTSYGYHVVELKDSVVNETLTMIVRRAGTDDYAELIRLGNVNFNYDATKPFEVSSFTELKTAIASNLTNIKVMADINFTANLQLKDDTTIDLNQYALNAGNYYLGKDESVGRRLTVVLENGRMTGQNGNGSIYVANSTSPQTGMDLTIKSVNYQGQMFIRQYVKGTKVNFEGQNKVETTRGSNIYAYNVIFKANSTYYGSTEGGGGSNESGSTVITLGNGSDEKLLFVEKGAHVELYPGSTGTSYAQNAVYGFSLLEVQEHATLKAAGKRPMLRTEYTVANAKVNVYPEASFDVTTTEAAEGFSYSYGIDYAFTKPKYLSIQSLNPTSHAFMYAYRNSSIKYDGTNLYGWTSQQTTSVADRIFQDITGFQLTGILSGNNMGVLQTSNSQLSSQFGHLNKYYRLTNQTVN